MQKSADEICHAFAQRLAEDTNTLLDISGRDPHMLALTCTLNTQLRRLRAERHRFQQGDFELKQAVTGISHDLRTPLTAISGYAQLLAHEALPPQAAQYLAVIQERTAALETLTEELFRFSVISATSDELYPQPLHLNGVLEESLAGFYAAFTQRGITPVVQLPQAPVARVLDKDALRRIYDNLLGNALKYSDGDLCITMNENGRTCFSNHAAALNTIDVQRMFDRFYTVENARGSTGLGLSIAKHLTERMGGNISADYADGVLTVTLQL